jgi:hypothetical protein
MEIKDINELNQKILDSYNVSRPRKLGRYSATDLSKMFKEDFINPQNGNVIKGLRPENFFEPSEMDMGGVKNIFRGYAYESQLAKEFDRLGVEYEKDGDNQLKIEYDVLGDRIITKEELESKDYKPPEIVLVMRPDFPMQKVVLETKAPNKLKDKIPDYYLEQCEIQYRLLKKKIIMVLINTGDNEYPLLLGIEFKPKEERWELIKNKVKLFHQKLVELNK